MHKPYENLETMRVSGIPITDFTDDGLSNLIEYHTDTYDTLDKEINVLCDKRMHETHLLVQLMRERNSRRA